MDSKQIHRLEIELKNAHIKEMFEFNEVLKKRFEAYDKKLPSMLFGLLADGKDEEGVLTDIYLHFLNRLIRFKEVETGKILSVFEI